MFFSRECPICHGKLTKLTNFSFPNHVCNDCKSELYIFPFGDILFIISLIFTILFFITMYLNDIFSYFWTDKFLQGKVFFLYCLALNLSVYLRKRKVVTDNSKTNNTSSV